MARPTGKTFEQLPIGQWPRHRALNIEVRGYHAWPDIASGEPKHAGAFAQALQGEDDAAMRRMAHKALDEALDKVLPLLIARQEYVVQRVETGRLYTVAHKVIRRTTRKLDVVCGVFSKGNGNVGAIFGTEQLATNWGECKACAAGVKWSSPEGADLFRREMLNG